MRPTFMLLSVCSLLLMSCGLINAQPSEIASILAFKKEFYKNDMKWFRRASFSSDGERFLVSDDCRFIELWKKPFSNPALAVSIEDYRTLVWMDFFEVSGERENIIFIEKGGMVQVWGPDLKTIGLKYNFPHPARHAAISEDGRYIATGGDLYDRQKKILVGGNVAHAVDTDVCFGGGNLVITSGYHDHGVAIRNIHTGEFEFRRSPNEVTGAAISPDEKIVVAVGLKGRCYLWPLPEGGPTALVIPKDMYKVKFSPDSRWFVVWGEEFAQIFQSDPPEKIARLQIKQGLTVLQVASANLIAVGNKDGEVYIYDVSSRRFIGRQKVCETGVKDMRLIPEKGLLWAGGCCLGDQREEKGEIALYRVNGLGPFIQTKAAGK